MLSTNKLLIIFYISILLYNYSNQKFITIPIKKTEITRNNLSHDDIFKYLTSKVYTTNIQIGSPPQNLLLSILLKETFTFLYTDETTPEILYPEGMKPFITKNSTTLNRYTNYNITDYHCNKYNVLTDSINIENKILQNYPILEAKDFYISLDNEIFSGQLGLGDMIYTQSSVNYANFIFNLKERDLINSYELFIEFYDNINGRIIIGGDPYDYNKNKYNHTTNTFSRHPNEHDLLFAGFSIDNIKYKLKDLNIGITQVEFILEQGVMEFGYQLEELLYQDYFNELVFNNICEKKKYSVYNFYVCKKGKFDKNKLGIISIYNKELDYSFNIDLSKLFMDYNDYSYFLVCFGKNNNTITLNDYFLKDYTFVFDIDKKITKFYNSNYISPISKNNSNIFISVLKFICIIVVLMALIIVLKKYYKKKRKLDKRQGLELETDADYIMMKKLSK